MAAKSITCPTVLPSYLIPRVRTGARAGTRARVYIHTYT